ncbi:MAG: RsmB/NOP family class I SAM-dependent RNA methyltransferase [Lachnospiraceae bacterium]|nr:RsmB/NOP family class I SAM-dependent RNA methyltransferase [Lachnospiraceae bacterium]
MELPLIYKNRMENMLGDDFPAYLACLDREPNHGIRVNTGKLSVEEFEQITPVPLKKPVPWCDRGWYYNKEDKPAKHPYYFAGLYYLQEPSAMTPAAILPIEPGDKVLDLCAAPGGKSTQAGSRLAGEGLLVSNDVSNSRAKALLKNIELFGIGNVLLTNEYSQKLATRFPGFFDKILIDAPCSGEGMFRRDGAVMKAWERNGPEFFYAIQKDIVRDAVTMLKPGGYILYSTCTFSVLEDECVISGLLHEFPQLEVVKVPDSESWGFVPGFTEHEDIPYPDPSLKNCMRLYPHKIDGEGHFVALIHWKDDSDGYCDRSVFDDNNRSDCDETVFVHEKKDNKSVCGKKTRKKSFGEEAAVERENLRFLDKNPDFADFCKLITSDFLQKGQLACQETRIYLRPLGLPSLSGLRYLRNGLLMGELKKNRFEPSQALAMYLKTEEFANTASFAADDVRVVKYLKGETIDCQGAEVRGGDGWCLVCVDGYPLGFAKRSRTTLKNKYFAPWRWL